MFDGILLVLPPLLLAATAAFVSEKAGILNIAIEGLILISAFTSVLVFKESGSLLIALSSGIASSVFFSLLLAFLYLVIHVDIFIAALGINLFCSALIALVSTLFYGNKGVIDVPNISFFSSIFPVLIAFILYLIVSIFIYYSSWGLTLRALGESESLVLFRKKNTNNIIISSYIVSGLLTGLSGVFLALRLSVFVPGLSAGRGWIALVAVFLGLRKPVGLLFAVFLFAFLEIATHRLQGFMGLSADFITMLPYLFTLVALVCYSFWRKRGEN